MNDSNSQELTEPCLLEAVDLHKSYKTSKQVLNVLSGTHLKLKAGEMLGIIGASGVGKAATTAFVASGFGMRGIDVSDPALPHQISFHVGGSTAGFALSSDSNTCTNDGNISI